jgi:hypothetical protein
MTIPIGEELDPFTRNPPTIFKPEAIVAIAGTAHMSVWS